MHGSFFCQQSMVSVWKIKSIGLSIDLIFHTLIVLTVSPLCIIYYVNRYKIDGVRVKNRPRKESDVPFLTKKLNCIDVQQIDLNFSRYSGIKFCTDLWESPATSSLECLKFNLMQCNCHMSVQKGLTCSLGCTLSKYVMSWPLIVILPVPGAMIVTSARADFRRHSGGKIKR